MLLHGMHQECTVLYPTHHVFDALSMTSVSYATGKEGLLVAGWQRSAETS